MCDVKRTASGQQSSTFTIVWGTFLSERKVDMGRASVEESTCDCALVSHWTVFSKGNFRRSSVCRVTEEEREIWKDKVVAALTWRVGISKRFYESSVTLTSYSVLTYIRSLVDNFIHSLKDVSYNDYLEHLGLLNWSLNTHLKTPNRRWPSNWSMLWTLLLLFSDESEVWTLERLAATLWKLTGTQVNIRSRPF